MPKFYLCMPLTQVQITTIKQTLIYDNLVHLIIAADNWAHARIKLRRFYVNLCVCGKHFHFPFKFNANLLAQQATFPYRPSGSLEHHLSRNWGLLSIFYFIFFFLVFLAIPARRACAGHYQHTSSSLFLSYKCLILPSIPGLYHSDQHAPHIKQPTVF